jgi:hypothetical protein
VSNASTSFVEQVYEDLKIIAKKDSKGLAAKLVNIPITVWKVSWAHVEVEADRRGGASEERLMSKLMATLGIHDIPRAVSNFEGLEELLDNAFSDYRAPDADNFTACS